MTRYHYEIVPRRPELGGGVRLRLLEDGMEVGGGVCPAGDSEAAYDIAWCDAQCEGEAWLESRPKDVPSAHMLTCSGIDYVPGALRVRDVRIADIAHALSLICRFGGHCAGHYSVAAHSLLVVRILEAMEAPPAALLCGLLHDAHEAYVGDVPTPIKAMLGTAWSDLEHQAEETVLDAFGLRTVMNDWRDLVKHADRVALATERRDLCHLMEMPTCRGRYSTGLSHSRSGRLWNGSTRVIGRRLFCGGLCRSRRLVMPVLP